MLLGGLLAILLFEVTLNFLPVSKGFVRTSDEAEWPLHNYAPHTNFTYSTGWDFKNPQKGKTNNFGHLAPFDFGPGRNPVIVIGDSYVESKMNRYGDTLQGQIGEKIGQIDRVFGLGAGGLSMSDYLVLAERAGRAFEPSAQVFLMIDGDLSESTQKRRGWNHFVRAADGSLQIAYQPQQSMAKSSLSLLLSTSSLYRYLRGNLVLAFPEPSEVLARLRAMRHPIATPVSSSPDAAMFQVIDYFLELLPLVNAVPAECTVFLLDDDRYPLYGLPAANPLDHPQLRAYFIQQARAARMHVIDLGPVFAAHFAHHHQRFDYSPFDRHWNRLGHAIAAQEAMRGVRGCAGLGRTQASTGDNLLRTR